MSKNSQSISNTVWSYARLGLKCTNFFKLLQPVTDSIFDDRTLIQNISNTTWAFCSLTLAHDFDARKIQKVPRIFQIAENRASMLVDGKTTQGPANMFWAAGTLQYYCPKLIAAIENISGQIASNAPPQVCTSEASVQLRAKRTSEAKRSSEALFVCTAPPLFTLYEWLTLYAWLRRWPTSRSLLASWESSPRLTSTMWRRDTLCRGRVSRICAT